MGIAKLTVGIAVATVALLWGYSQSHPAEQAADARQRHAEARAVVRVGAIKHATRDVDGNQLVQLQIPVGSAGSHVFYRTCWVWRDQEFKTATMHCDHDDAPGLIDEN